MENMLTASKKRVVFYRQSALPEEHEDYLTREEPLAITISYYDSANRLHTFPLSITMRTPGNDEELCKGFLLSEGIIDSNDQIKNMTFKRSSENPLLRDQSIQVTLQDNCFFQPDQFRRNFYSSSSCGVCGKNSIEQLERQIKTILPKAKPIIDREKIFSINQIMKKGQTTFHKTGGIHGTAVFNEQLELECIMEDVGRHNAMDKVIGNLMKSNDLPAKNKIVSVSGRAGFELVQKALVAGFGIMTAVGAPSDLAVDLAHTYGMTLIGFLKNDQFNVYSHPQRIVD
ncbi:MAG: formate dehydrogenase accessory sulfurtransferase FdhD [Saprospirales bacterium]|nr:MAG: formate dehydrogenase accessory sulfurtransferase FdhD [Saprospirales bacterium]